MINYGNKRGGRKCVIWTRVSTKYQEDNGGSLKTQEEICRAYAKTNHYQVVGEVFGGKHESAKTPGKLITGMKTYVHSHKDIGYILVSEFDRFSRDVPQATKMLHELREDGVIVIATKYGISTETKDQMMMATNMVNMAEWDNQNRTDKFVDGRSACIAAGAWVEKAPMGYEKEGKSRNTWCRLNNDGRLIAKAFRWKLQGKTNAEILDKLAAEGLRISKQTLHKILVNPFYAGMIKHKATKMRLIEGQIEPAISYDDFKKVQDILSGKTGKYQHKAQKPECPLTHYVRCAKDGTPFTSYKVKAKNLDYYKCNQVGCKTNVSAKEMHRKYEDLLVGYNVPKEVLDASTDIVREILSEYSVTAERELTEYRRQMSVLENKEKGAIIRFGLGEIPQSVYEIAINDVSEKKALIQEEIDKWSLDLSNLEKQIPEVIATASNIGTLWCSSDYASKREIQNLVFPDGILWDSQIRDYRTSKRNSVFEVISKISDT